MATGPDHSTAHETADETIKRPDPEANEVYAQNLANLIPNSQEAYGEAAQRVLINMLRSEGLDRNQQQELMTFLQDPEQGATPAVLALIKKYPTRTLLHLQNDLAKAETDMGTADAQREKLEKQKAKLEAENKEHLEKIKKLRTKIREEKNHSKQLQNLAMGARTDDSRERYENEKIRIDQLIEDLEDKELEPLQAKSFKKELNELTEKIEATEKTKAEKATEKTVLEEAIAYAKGDPHRYHSMTDLLWRTQDWIHQKNGVTQSPEVTLGEVEALMSEANRQAYQTLDVQVYEGGLQGGVRRTLANIKDPYLQGKQLEQLARDKFVENKAEVEVFWENLEKPSEEIAKMKLARRAALYMEIAATQVPGYQPGAAIDDQPDDARNFLRLKQHLDSIVNDYIKNEGTTELKKQDEFKEASNAECRLKLLDDLEVKPDDLQMRSRDNNRQPVRTGAKLAGRRAKAGAKRAWNYGDRSMKWYAGLTEGQKTALKGTAKGAGIGIGLIALAAATPLTLGGAGVAALGVKYRKQIGEKYGENIKAGAKLALWAGLGPFVLVSKRARSSIKENAKKMVGASPSAIEKVANDSNYEKKTVVQNIRERLAGKGDKKEKEKEEATKVTATEPPVPAPTKESKKPEPKIPEVKPPEAKAA